MMKEIIKKIIVPLFLIALLSCGFNQKQDSKPMVNQNLSLVPKIAFDSTTYMKDFKEFSDWDSTMIINGKRIIITVSLINGSDFFIPSQYTSDTNKVIKQILTKIELLDGNRKELLTLSTNDVKNDMDKEDEKIVKYGVLMLSKNDVSYKNDTLKLIYGYSIPYTDIGNQVTILVNTSNLEKSVHVEY